MFAQYLRLFAALHLQVLNLLVYPSDIPLDSQFLQSVLAELEVVRDRLLIHPHEAHLATRYFAPTHAGDWIHESGKLLKLLDIVICTVRTQRTLLGTIHHVLEPPQLLGLLMAFNDGLRSSATEAITTTMDCCPGFFQFDLI